MGEHPFDMLPKGQNPYWLVWLAATGGGPSHEYMIWNGREWADFDKRNGLDERQRRLNGPRFKIELAEKYAAQIEARYRSPTAIEQRGEG